jgi:hypothetical protein
MNLKFFGGAALALALASSVAMAGEQLVRMSPDMHFRYGKADTGETSQNVTVNPADIASLPDYIQERIRGLLFMCAGDTNQQNNVRVYTWSGDRHAKKGLPPNIVIDFNGVKASANAAKCVDRPICNAEGCLVYGFTPTDANAWEQDFEIRSTRIGFITTAAPTGTSSRTELQTLSNKADCLQSGGAKTPNGCLRRFEWRNYGLKVLPAGQ